MVLSRSDTRAVAVVGAGIVVLGFAFPFLARRMLDGDAALFLARTRQAGVGSLLYVQDSDGGIPPANHHGGRLPTPSFIQGRPDRVWTELVNPYVQDSVAFRRPGAPDNVERVLWVHPATGRMIGKKDPHFRYVIGLRSALGMNHTFLSPWVALPDDRATSRPARIEWSHPARTIFLAESVWGRDAHGIAYGAGRWVVQAPCHLGPDGRSLVPLGPGDRWIPAEPQPWGSLGGFYGVGPTVLFLDGHARRWPWARFREGCDPETGRITDPERDLWAGISSLP